MRMKINARALVWTLAIATIVAGFPRAAKAEGMGTALLIGGIAGAVIGGIVGLTSMPPAKRKPPAVAPSAAQQLPSWLQSTAGARVADHPVLPACLFTF